MRHGEFIQLDSDLLANLASTERKDKYHVAAACGLFQLTASKPVKLTASQQKAIFGAYIFGKANILFDPTGQGTVHVWSSVDFGLDVNSNDFTFDEALALVASGEKWHCGCINPRREMFSKGAISGK